MNRYYNHLNAFVPGTVVRADEANDQLDAIEVGFDRVQGFAMSLVTDTKDAVMAEVTPQLFAHRTDVENRLAAIQGLTTDEINAFRVLVQQFDRELSDALARVIRLPRGSGSLEIGGAKASNSVPYIDASGDAALMPLPSIMLPSDWTRVYLGRHATAPTKDNANQPVTEGAMYYNTASNRLEVFRNSVWVPGFISGSGVVTVSNIEPPNPEQGDLWFDSQTADLMLWYTDADSNEWVVVNSHYNALFGPGTLAVLSDGSVAMTEPLTLSNKPPGMTDAVSRQYVESFLRNLQTSGAVVAATITSGVDPRSPVPSTRLTNTAPPPYDVRIAGNMLFFGNVGYLDASYGVTTGGVPIQPGDALISDGTSWNLIRGSSGASAAVPKATAQGQILVSGATPGFSWGVRNTLDLGRY